jgi:hypothetical protein
MLGFKLFFKSSSALTDGYDLRIVNNVVSFNWNNGNNNFKLRNKYG